jgi:hypothetical protein
MSPTKAGGVRVMTVNLADTYVDEHFQRPLKDAFVQKIISNFDEKMLGVLIVNKRPDTNGSTYSITDGQQRRAALMQLNRKTAAAVVFEIDEKEEANLFNALQRERRAVTSLERHKAAVYGGDPIAVRLDRITKQNGFTIASSSVSSITALTDKAKVGWTMANYDRTLKIISHAWDEDTPQATSYEVVMGLWMFLERAGKKATVEEVTDALFEYWPRNIVRDSKLEKANDTVSKGRIGSAAWVIAKQFNKFHRRKGVNAVPEKVFTHSFRVSLGMRTRKSNKAVNTGSSSQNEFTSPLSGDDE